MTSLSLYLSTVAILCLIISGLIHSQPSSLNISWRKTVIGFASIAIRRSVWMKYFALNVRSSDLSRCIRTFSIILWMSRMKRSQHWISEGKWKNNWFSAKTWIAQTNVGIWFQVIGSYNGSHSFQINFLRTCSRLTQMLSISLEQVRMLR